MSLGDIPAADKIICTIGICSSFKERPIETLTFWEIRIPSSSITRLGEVTSYLSISKLLNAVLSQLLQEYLGDVTHFQGLFRCFQNARRNRVATLRVPDFSQNVNLEILGFRTFAGTLEDCFAEIAQPSYATSVFSSEDGNTITQAFLSNSPEVLLGIVNRNLHAHFVILIEECNTSSLPPITLPIELPTELPTEPFSEFYFPPENLSESTLEFALESTSESTESTSSEYSSESRSESTLEFIESTSESQLSPSQTYADYLYQTFERRFEAGVYSSTGGTKRKLWLSVRNHRNTCELLALGGFTTLYDDEEYIQFPSGQRLSLEHILTVEFNWVVSTFKKKWSSYHMCAQYSSSHRWNMDLYPPMPEGTIVGSAIWRDKKGITDLLEVWKRIVAMFGLGGYASLASPPLSSSSNLREILAAKLTENILPKVTHIKFYLIPRIAGDEAYSWF